MLFVLMSILAFTLSVQQSYQSGNFKFFVVMFFRQLLLLCSIIPISMRVNLDFAKLIYSYRINQDKEIEGSLARNS
jgi:phospholipid-translocating ATPase